MWGCITRLWFITNLLIVLDIPRSRSWTATSRVVSRDRPDGLAGDSLFCSARTTLPSKVSSVLLNLYLHSMTHERQHIKSSFNVLLACIMPIWQQTQLLAMKGDICGGAGLQPVRGCASRLAEDKNFVKVADTFYPFWSFKMSLHPSILISIMGHRWSLDTDNLTKILFVHDQCTWEICR